MFSFSLGSASTLFRWDEHFCHVCILSAYNNAKNIKINQDFPELWTQMYCHLSSGSQCILVSRLISDIRKQAILHHNLMHFTWYITDCLQNAESSTIFQDLVVQGQGQGLVNWSSRILEDKDFTRGQLHWEISCPRGPIYKFLSLSLNLKSLYSSSDLQSLSLDHKVPENCRELSFCKRSVMCDHVKSITPVPPPCIRLRWRIAYLLNTDVNFDFILWWC